MKKRDLYWLAGLLEGEGSFLAGPPSRPNQPRISVQMNDEDVIERVADLLGVAYFQARQDKRNPKWSTYYCLQLKGFKAILLMERLRPLMGNRRQVQIDRAVASYVPKAKGARLVRA